LIVGILSDLAKRYRTRRNSRAGRLVHSTRLFLRRLSGRSSHNP
jgi:hypothetical protein